MKQNGAARAGYKHGRSAILTQNIWKDSFKYLGVDQIAISKTVLNTQSWRVQNRQAVGPRQRGSGLYYLEYLLVKNTTTTTATIAATNPTVVILFS